MSYTAQANKGGREPVYIVEIDLDYCSLTYGTMPCTAVLGTTGPIKCFNTNKTCQATAAYAPAAKTYRFASRYLPASSDPVFNGTIPSVQSVMLAPTVLMPGSASPASTTSGGATGTAGLGKRASITITFRDHPTPDNGIDKYVTERPYNSATQGTFWNKLIARNPYYQNRVVRVKSGYITTPMDQANFQTRTYILDQISGPDSKGMVTIVAKDPLKLLDNDRTQAPNISIGTLANAMDAVTPVLTLATGYGIFYPASGTVIVGKECMSYTLSGDVMTVVRQTVGTTVAPHAAGDPVQLCLTYTSASLYTVLYDLLVTRAGVPAVYIDTAGWMAEMNTWLSDCSITVAIPKPTGINQLVSELCEQFLFFIWWDERKQLIKFKAIRPSQRDIVTPVNDTNNVIADTQTKTDRPNDRLTQVIVCFSLRDPTLDLKNITNFAAVQVAVDAQAQGPQQYGDDRTRIIYSRWLTAQNASFATKLGNRLINRYRDVPKTVVVRLDAKDSSLWTGDVVQATIRSLVGPTGAKLATNLLILQVQETVVGSEYEYTMEDTFFKGRYCFITPASGVPAYSLATADQKNRYGFICGPTLVYTDGQPADKII